MCYYSLDLAIIAVERYPTLNMTKLEGAIDHVQHSYTDLKRRYEIRNQMDLEDSS